MAKLKFYIRSEKKANIAVIIRAYFSLGRGKEYYAKLPHSIPKESWDPKRESIKDNTRFDDTFTHEGAQTIVNNLTSIRTFVLSTYNSTNSQQLPKDWLQNTIDIYYQSKAEQTKDALLLKSEDRPKTLNAFIDQYIEDAESGKRLTRERGERFAPGTIKTLKGFQSQFLEYQEKKNVIIDFNDITMDFYFDFKQFFSVTKQYSINTTGKLISQLKTIMFAAKDLHLHENSEFLNSSFHADSVDVDNIAISDERLKLLYKMAERLANAQEKGISEKTRAAWLPCLDVFLVGCWSGQRFSDYSRINTDMIITDNGRKFIKLIQQKGKKTIYIPLMPQVEHILNRNGGKLPKVWEQKVNQYIKLICEKLEFTEPVKIQLHKGAMNFETEQRFCDLVKTHTARRSFATNLHKSGAPLSYIMIFTGHSSEALVRKYLKLNDIEKAHMAAQCKYFKKMQIV